ncbi:tumor necrosis factor receptor superfamily member 9-like [Carcharodon carcharias]|uniref:tumor necrosis factor receptor superfamily member 9-like n=1 Tax=Carcharodon carcharias TaxID=13397 RepID=UPI001B7F6194|nr:tumor necrosis factor receptor superfamily member 9-like [Carcharodon carcharias]
MEGALLLALLVLSVKVSLGSDCSAGSFLNSQNEKCTPCPAGSYTESPNRSHSCKRCQLCYGGKFLILESCTATSNTKCSCVEGFKCTTMECTSCEAHKVCKKGQEVQKKGDSFRDTICRDCRHGTYSNTEGEVCKSWTNCLEQGLQVMRIGSQTTDNICGDPLTIPTIPTSSVRLITRAPKQSKKPSEDESQIEGIAGIFAIILLLCIFIPFSLFIVVQRIKQKHLPLDVVNHEDLPVALVTAVDDRCSYHCPEEEMGDWQLRQETTPKPPE